MAVGIGGIELRADVPQGSDTIGDLRGGDLRGMVAEATIALVSRWEGRACLGTWIGELVECDGRDAIMLSWEMVRHFDDPDRPTDVTMGQALASH